MAKSKKVAREVSAPAPEAIVSEMVHPELLSENVAVVVDNQVIDNATGDVIAAVTDTVESESETGLISAGDAIADATDTTSDVKVTFAGVVGLYGNAGTISLRDCMAFPQWNIPRNGRLDHMQETAGIVIIDSMITSGYSASFALTAEPWSEARHAKPYAIAREMYMVWLDARIKEAEGKGVDALASATAAKEYFFATYKNKDGSWRNPKLVIIDGNSRFAAVIIANGVRLHNDLPLITSATVTRLTTQTTDDQRLIIQSGINHMQGKTIPVTPLGQLAVARMWIGDGERAARKTFAQLYAGADIEKKDLNNLLDQVYPVAILDWQFPELLIIERLVNAKAHGDNGLVFAQAFGQHKRSDVNSAAKRAVPSMLNDENERLRIAHEKSKKAGATEEFVPLTAITADEVKALIARKKEDKTTATKAETNAKLDAVINSKKSSPAVAALATSLKAEDFGAIEVLQDKYGELLTLAARLGSDAIVALIKSAEPLTLQIATSVCSNLTKLGPDELEDALSYIVESMPADTAVEPVDEHAADTAVIEASTN